MPQSNHTQAVPSDAHPACPDCESDVFVDAMSHTTGTYHCQLCNKTFKTGRISMSDASSGDAAQR